MAVVTPHGRITLEGLSQADLARVSGLHPGAISNIENGETNPTLQTVNAPAVAPQVEPLLLYRRERQGNP